MTLDGVTQNAPIDSEGNFSTTFDTGALPAALTPYQVTYAYAGDTNFNGVSDDSTTTLTVGKATPIVTWVNPADIVYGTALSATQLNANASVAGTIIYAPAITAILNAGQNQTLSAVFTPTDATDYNIVDATAEINVTKATPVVTWSNPADITFGTALSITQLDATANVAGAFDYTPDVSTILSAGQNQTLSAVFTPTDTNDYNIVDATAQINVAKATPGVTWANPNDITVGTALGATQLNATANVGGVFKYTPPTGTVLGVGANQTLSTEFTPTDTTDYNTVDATAQINVNTKTTPVVTWINPADITFGTKLSVKQLDATANVAGVFVYTPAAGTTLGAGQNQTLSVVFTPTDTADFNTVDATAQINVAKATPIISWENPANITVGTVLSGTQLDASANVAGSFVYTPPAGTVLSAGTNQTLSAIFTPTDATDYNTANASAHINVIQGTNVLPAGWSDLDIGSPRRLGSASYSSGIWTIKGGGADIWNGSDHFNYAFESIHGSVSIVARVTGLTNTDPWAKAGVMLRDGSGANAAFADIVVTPGNGVAFQWRTTAGRPQFQRQPNWDRGS